MNERGLNLIDQKIDRYQITSLLVEDRLGAIYKAHDPKFDRTVALYLVNAQISRQNHLDEYILQAARTILSWRHAGLARVYDFGKLEDGVYVIQEFIPGPNLTQILKDMRAADSWIEMQEAVLLVKELCLAIEFAHQRGLVHGDIHPGNVFFKPEAAESLPYQPILARTGFVKPSLPALNTSSAQYSSPEGIQGKHIEKYADVYSLGAILYKLATGKSPAPQNPAASTSSQILAPRMLHSELPESIEKVILRALAVNPDDRFTDANSMAAALNAVLADASKIHSTPSGTKDASPLLPFFQQSLKMPERVVFSAPVQKPAGSAPIPAVDISLDQVHVLAPDKSLHSFAMKSGGLTIGRSAENDIQLDFSGISRHHARIEFDGENYLVQDLSSLNGTFLEEKRLPSDAPHVWLSGENVRIGEAWLRFERAGQARTTQAVVPETLPTQPGKASVDTDEVFLRSDGSSIDPNQVLRSANLGWIGAYTDLMNPSVTPGNSLEIPILLFNRGPASDTYLLSIQGIPAEWLAKPPQPVRVPSNSQSQAQLVIRPPRSPVVRAGRYSMTIRVMSQASPDQVVELRPTLTVTAFSLFTSEIRPQEIRPSDTGQVFIHNRGNLPETFSVLWEDHTQTLVFDPPQMKINLQAGKSAVVEFHPSPLHMRLMGAEITHPFRAHVSSQSGQVQSHQGNYISRSLLPAWAPFLFAAISLILACVICIFLNQVTFPVRRAERTAQAGRTSIALATQTAILVRTQTATTLAGANLATLQAATATSAWLALDSDNDGLSNSLELLAGSDPYNPDSDGDGLLDGVEVYTWKTNPVLADTDGDGLSDGEEINLGTNPLEKDTDGDGILDGIDPDPLHPPTKTSVAFPTFTQRPPATNTPWWQITPIWIHTPTFTPTPTRTSTSQPPTTDLSISISNGSSAVIPGTNTVYTILVTNKGSLPVSNVQIVDVFPSSLSNITWMCMASPGSLCLTGNGTGNVNAFANLASGGTATLTISASIAPNATGLLSNTARVNPPGGITDSNPADNQATDTDTLTPRVALSLSKTDNRDSLYPGQATSYTIIVFNNGPSTVNGVTVQDTFSDKLTALTWACSATSGSSCGISGSQTGNINTQVNLNPGGTATFNINATLKSSATGTLSNTASIISPIDPATNNKTATDATNIIPQANLLMVATAPVSANVSTSITYTVSITNNGPNVASGITLTSTFGSGGVFVSSTPGSPTCQENAGVVTCNLGNLPINSTTQVVIIVTAPAFPGNFSNLFEVKATEVDPVPANNSQTVLVIIN